MAGATVATTGKQFVSAVVYACDCQHTIGAFLDGLLESLEAMFERYEVVCVDDASLDGSNREIERIAALHQDATISIVGLGRRHGVELAMRAGVDAAIGDFVFLFENTASWPGSEAITAAFATCSQGNDIVWVVPAGSRSPATSRAFYRVFNRYAGLDTELCTDLFSLVTRRAINRVQQLNITTPLAKAAYASCGLACATVEIPVTAGGLVAHGGFSRERRERAFDSLLFYTDIGYRFAKWLSVIMIIVTLATLAYSAVVYLVGNPVAGWTTTMLLVSLCFTGVFLLLAIIVKYLALILKQLSRRGSYVLRGIRKATGKDVR